LGGLHCLVNNAGIYQPSTLMETDTELFERHTRVNQLGCFERRLATMRAELQKFGAESRRSPMPPGRRAACRIAFFPIPAAWALA
jgi:NAD(P)-dependent dehydrogenase (short-subunit alcohol dehydrogenase family)